jgi:hypothetical protein
VAVKTQESAVESGEHVVQFYEHDAEPLEAAGPHLDEGALEEAVNTGRSQLAGGSRFSGA